MPLYCDCLKSFRERRREYTKLRQTLDKGDEHTVAKVLTAHSRWMIYTGLLQVCTGHLLVLTQGGDRVHW